jgi:hypothetical protein
MNLKREIGSANGAEIFETVRTLPQTNAALVATNQTSARPNKTGDTRYATGSVVSNAVPVGQLDGSVVGHLWLMLASHRYLSSVATNRLTPVYDVSASAPINPNLKYKAEWELIAGPGSLPASVTYYNGDGSTNAVYRATGVTNLDGLVLPSGFFFECYVGRSLAAVRKRASFIVTAVRPSCSRASLLPTVTQQTLVVDRRIRQATQPAKDVAYRMEASSTWPSADEARSLNGGTRTRPRRSPLVVLLVGALLCPALVAFAVHLRKRLRNAASP